MTSAVSVGGASCPASSDPRWAEWARPLAAFLREPRSLQDVVRFTVAHRAPVTKAANLLSWLDLEGLIASASGSHVLTAEGRTWLGDYRLPLASLVATQLAHAPEKFHPSERPRDLAGKRQEDGRLTAVRQVGKDRYGHAQWECRCTCGKLVVVLGRYFEDGRTSSCGCLQAEMRRLGPKRTRSAA